MRKLASLLGLCLVVAFVALPLHAQQFSQFYSNADVDLESALPLSNGDILVCGSVPRPNQKRSAMLMRLDGTGQQQWCYRRNDTTYSHFIVAKERAGGQGYVVGGWCEINPAMESSIGMVALVDTNGVITNMHFTGGNDRINQIRIMGNGDLHFGGGTTGLFSSNPPTFLRTTSALVPLSFKVQHSALSYESSGGTDVTADGWITMANGGSLNGSPYTMAFSRHPATGTGSFIKNIDCGQDAFGRAVVQLASGTHFYLGTSTIGAVKENVLLRISSSGNILMAKTFHKTPVSANSQYATSMRLTHPDSVLIWGNGAAGGWICRTDTLGNVVWMKNYSLPNAGVTIKDVNQLPNGDFLITGGISTGAMLIRTGPAGLINCAASPGLGTVSTFANGTTTATANTWSMGAAQYSFDSLVQRTTVGITPPPLNTCNPPCNNSISSQLSNICSGNIGYYCATNPFGTVVGWTMNGAPAGNANCVTVTHNALGNEDTLALTSVVNGCTTTTSLTVNVPVQYGATFTSVINQLTVNFANTTLPPYTSVLWNFGDNNTSTVANPMHTYAALGTYNVCLYVTGACGTRAACQSITVTCAPPTASFSSSGSNLVWNFTSTVSSSYPVTYAWTFGDGGTSSIANPNHNYAAPGTYNVCLTATSQCGAVQACSTITVICPQPAAVFSTSGTLLTYNFSPALVQGQPTSYAWTFGDGNTSSLVNPSHPYAVQGVYTVCLTVGNACGFFTWCDTITVNCPSPASNFGFTNVSLAYNFFAPPTGGIPTTYSWDFGDGFNSSNANPSHTYATPNTYNVCLTTTTVCGTSQTCSLTVVSSPPPNVNFGSSGNRLAWSFSSSVNGVGPFTYSWNFGNGTTSNLPNPSIVFIGAGTYTVCLTVIDVYGQGTTICDTITVICPMPAASFTANLVGQAYQFQSTVTGTQGLSYSWTFGDQTTSVMANPSHVYSIAGFYYACLIVNDSCGADTSCQLLNYNPVSISHQLPEGVKVWPIPVKDQVQIAGNFEGWISVYDVQGQLLLSQYVGLIGQTFTMEMGQFAQALYYVQFRSEMGQWMIKLPKIE
jgi:PKD repeat protein